MILEFLVFVAILIFAVVDFRSSEIPSFATTTVILALLLIQPNNLIWGISAFVFGFLLYEFDFLGGRFFGGIADIKVMTIIGLMISNLIEFATLMITTTGLSVIFSIMIYYFNNKEMPKEIPFIPVLLLVYLIVWLMRLLL